MHVTQFVNSFVNRPGNIGVRTGHILKHLNSDAVCVCRGAQDQLPGIDYREMGVFGHIPRLLNGLRIRFAPEFDHRRWDIAMYEGFALRKSRCLKTNVAHVWDVCPNLIKNLKKSGIPVILDIPIAPSFYGEQLYRKGIANFLRSSLRMQQLETSAISEADLLLVPSEFVASVLREMNVIDDRIAVVEFGVDIPCAIGMQNRRRKSDKIGIDYCFFGNINKRKGISELVAAWSSSEFSHDRLHLCGRVNSDIHNDLSIATGGTVVLPGFVNPFQYMVDCDVFVLPSWLEGSAKAVYEAMACGLPCVVTHSTGSVVRDGIDGFVINAGDVNALKDRMLWFKRNPEQIEIMGNAAKQRASEFTWARYSQRVIAHYENIVRNDYS